MSTTKFFELSDAASRGRWAFSSGYGSIDDLSFLRPDFLASHIAFWEVNPRESGLLVDCGGARWPDIMGCGFAPPAFVISRRVVDDLTNIGVSFSHLTRMPIGCVDLRGLVRESAPEYFVAQTIPGIEVDFAASNIPIDEDGRPILTPPPKPWPPIIVVRSESWSCADIFAFSNYGTIPHLEILCSQRVQELAKERKWTNSRFSPLLAK